MWTMIRKQAPHLDACMHFRKLRCLYILLQCLPLLVHIIVDLYVRIIHLSIVLFVYN